MLNLDSSKWKPGPDIMWKQKGRKGLYFVECTNESSISTEPHVLHQESLWSLQANIWGKLAV